MPTINKQTKQTATYLLLLDAVRLPLLWTNGKGPLSVLSILVRTGRIQRNANVHRAPRQIRVAVPHAAHVAGLVVLLALLAHGEAIIWKFHPQRLVETRRGELQYVAHAHHLLGGIVLRHKLRGVL